ncbi:Sec-independent protein translocase subunit TatA/TatB [Anaerosinus massiliensis]|uniref:Sec-independent protein translocase subunit TatA/TatB n=1 Tax=Massilibacillus massiliensis TaxID=1806837 RepID=UPI000DA637B3|nr:twin-arginine translocase TatA/TatE family subunit [Massilibacillus massiliensis]
MFGLGMPEIALIAVIGLIVFGPGRLPEVGKSIGKSIGEIRNAINEPPPAQPPQKIIVEATTPTTETIKKTSET